MSQTLSKEPAAKSGRSYRGGCFCGGVQIQVTGEPVAAGYCHCASCRHWSAGPINAFTLWKPEAVEVIQGQNLLASYHKTERSNRRWCKECGGHVYTDHPAWGLVDVYAAVIADFPFRPGVHVNYGEHVVRVADGLPKQHDLPAEMGGTGVIVAE
jgi:hypothetical protein